MVCHLPTSKAPVTYLNPYLVSFFKNFKNLSVSNFQILRNRGTGTLKRSERELVVNFRTYIRTSNHILQNTQNNNAYISSSSSSFTPTNDQTRNYSPSCSSKHQVKRTWFSSILWFEEEGARTQNQRFAFLHDRSRPPVCPQHFPSMLCRQLAPYEANGVQD